jgi:hypothetical protein
MTKESRMLQFLGAEDGAGRYVDWGVFHISVANVAIIALMVVVFVLAVILPFPGPAHRGRGGPR